MGVYTTKRNQATGDVELIRSAGTIPPSFASLSDDLVINGSKELGLSSKVTTKLSNFNDDGTIASGKPLGNKFDESKDYLIGKNLIDISSMERHTLDGDAGKSTGYITNTRACTAYIPVEGGKTYVLSCTNTDFKFGIWQYFDIDVFDSASGISSGSTNSYFSFTVQNTTKYIKMVFSVASDATKEFALSALVNLQLELGSTPTTYEPFRKSNVELTNELSNKINYVDYTKIQSLHSWGASNSGITYTATVSGLLFVSANAGNGYFRISINNTEVAYYDQTAVERVNLHLPIRQGDVVKYETADSSRNYQIYIFKQI